MMRLLVALIVATPLVVAAQSQIPRYDVKRAAGPLSIDGKLDEADWAAAPAVTLQFLWESQTGAKQMTRARLLWDAQALYVGFDADDSDITAQYQERDDPTYRDDAVEIFINPNPQQEAVYYGFEMNARGVLYDYLNYNSRTLFKRWDGIAFPFGPFSNFDTRLPNSRNRQWLSPDVTPGESSQLPQLTA